MNTPQSTPSAAPGNVYAIAERAQRIAELLADKQAIAARMQHDINKYGELSCDYSEPLGEIELELNDLRSAPADLAVKAGQVPNGENLKPVQFHNRHLKAAEQYLFEILHVFDQFGGRLPKEDATTVRCGIANVRGAMLLAQDDIDAPAQEGAKNNEGALREAALSCFNENLTNFSRPSQPFVEARFTDEEVDLIRLALSAPVVREAVTERTEQEEVARLRIELANATELSERRLDVIQPLRRDARRWKSLEKSCEMLDDEPTGFFFSVDPLPEVTDVWEAFTAAVDAKLGPETAPDEVRVIDALRTRLAALEGALPGVMDALEESPRFWQAVARSYGPNHLALDAEAKSLAVRDAALTTLRALTEPSSSHASPVQNGQEGK